MSSLKLRLTESEAWTWLVWRLDAVSLRLEIIFSNFFETLLTQKSKFGTIRAIKDKLGGRFPQKYGGERKPRLSESFGGMVSPERINPSTPEIRWGRHKIER